MKQYIIHRPDGKERLDVTEYPGRKRPLLVRWTKDHGEVLARFESETAAEQFIDALRDILGEPE